ncbi:hypothetical protein CBM2623_U50006 [Cupriavidus taiwanensis]|nr:hypothetical protein CBM2623_U50006 [Cupriavidus taiwanensis]
MECREFAEGFGCGPLSGPYRRKPGQVFALFWMQMVSGSYRRSRGSSHGVGHLLWSDIVAHF